MSGLVLRQADEADAADLLQVIHAAFAARPPVEPPAAALSDSVADIADQLRQGTGLLVTDQEVPVAGLLISGPEDGVCVLRRVSVLPGYREHGLAGALVREAALLCADRGAERIELLCRREFPDTLRWWRSHGFEIDRETELGWILAIAAPARIIVPTPEAMHHLGQRLATLLIPGDLVVATGELGAGKTTLTQGLGAAMDVDGPVISPTFVLSRVHPARGSGPALVHVDAYRLGSAAELEDLDLDATLADSVTVIEWGAGVAEGLSDSRLEVEIRRSATTGEEQRVVYLIGLGPRWAEVDLSAWALASKGSTVE